MPVNLWQSSQVPANPTQWAVLGINSSSELIVSSSCKVTLRGGSPEPATQALLEEEEEEGPNSARLLGAAPPVPAALAAGSEDQQADKAFATLPAASPLRGRGPVTGIQGQIPGLQIYSLLHE